MTLSTPQYPGSHSPSEKAAVMQPDEQLAGLITELRSEKSSPFSKHSSSTSRQGKLNIWWQCIGLRTKASVLAVLLGILPAVGVGTIAYNIANQENLNQLKALERQRVSNLQLVVESFMSERHTDIQYLANLDILADPKLRGTVTSQQKAEVLDQIMTSHRNVYTSIAFLDLAGNPIAQTSQGETVSNHPAPSQIQSTDRAILSQPFLSNSSGKFSIYSTSGVKDNVTGQPIGYVSAQIPVEAIETLLSDFDDNVSKFYLASESGEIFLSSESSHVIPVNSANQSVSLSESIDVQVLTLADIFPDISGIVQNDRREATTVRNVLADTYEVIAFSPFLQTEGSPDLNWSAITSVDLALLKATQRRLFFEIALGTLAAAGMATGLAIWITRKFTQPILRAANVVNKIGQGDLRTRLEVTGQDEIAQLGTNINQMAEQLKQFNNEQQTAARRSKLLASATSIADDLNNEHNQTQLNLFVEQVRTFLHSDRVVLYHLNETQILEQNESTTPNQSSIFDNTVPTLFISQTELERYTNGQLLIADDIAIAELTEGLRQRWQALQVKSALVIPVVGQNSLFGLLTIHHVQGLHIWTESEINFCSQLGQQLGILKTAKQYSLLAEEQKVLKENLQKRALELMLEVDPVSQGDLTVRAQVTADEIGTIADSYNATIASLKKIVGQVQTASQRVTATASQNEASIQDLSQAAQQQTQEISNPLNKLDRMVNSSQAVANRDALDDSIVKQTTATVDS